MTDSQRLTWLDIMSTLLAIDPLPGDATEADDRPCVLVVVGAPGTAEYEAEFRRWADHWQAAAAKAGGRVRSGSATGAEGRRRRSRPAARGPGREGVGRPASRSGSS